jgi:agmatine/peptidylarginine deiminase
MKNTPAGAGFYMPAEWEKHEYTQLGTDIRAFW